ncbi:hypothetical protein VTJ49DRAFT_5015 [Mycothermus thermophilus]|uniref:Uncharacterized protein n=1 Tax=Humicola insolens TaxID=85995 RepID=A0ABR3VL60_HUMIN
MEEVSRHVNEGWVLLSRFVSPGWETKRRSLGTEGGSAETEGPEMTPTTGQSGAMIPRSGRSCVLQECRVSVSTVNSTGCCTQTRQWMRKLCSPAGGSEDQVPQDRRRKTHMRHTMRLVGAGAARESYATMRNFKLEMPTDLLNQKGLEIKSMENMEMARTIEHGNGRSCINMDKPEVKTAGSLQLLQPLWRSFHGSVPDRWTTNAGAGMEYYVSGRMPFWGLNIQAISQPQTLRLPDGLEGCPRYHTRRAPVTWAT